MTTHVLNSIVHTSTVALSDGAELVLRLLARLLDNPCKELAFKEHIPELSVDEMLVRT